MSNTGAATVSTTSRAQAWTGSSEGIGNRLTSAAQIEALANEFVPEAGGNDQGSSSNESTFVASATPQDAISRSAAANLIDFPTFPEVQSRSLASIVLAEWEGSVLDVRSDGLTAGLVAIRGGQHDKEKSDGDIPWDEIAESDRDLVRLGALFRLTVGYQVDNGTRSRFSRVVFRRLPAWTRRDIEGADALAIEQFNAISVE